MRLLLDEARKHRAFREAWIGYLLSGIYLLLALHTYSLGNISEVSAKLVPMIIAQNWYSIHQDIYAYGASITAFLLTIGLPRLICYERERRTDCLIGTSEKGRFLSWKSKAIFTVIYCAIVVSIIGAVSLLAHYTQFGLKGALWPVTHCIYFCEEALPPMSNLAYCILQYGFLFLGALYFAGFILLVAAITKRTALTIFLCGASYLVCTVYKYVGSIFPGKSYDIFGVFFRFGFGGYLMQDSYSWTWPVGLLGKWTDIWKPVLLVIGMIIIEFAGLWFLWRRRERK